MGYLVNSATGRVVGGQVDTIFTPRVYNGGYGVILCHGAGNPDNFMDPVNQPASCKLAANIASAGFPCIAGNFGGDLWGNDTQCGHLDNARAVLASAIPGLKTDKILLLGGSHGGAMAVRYAIERPKQVAGIVGIIPALDINYLWNNVAALRASIGAAYGVAYPDPLPVDARTIDRATELVGVPQFYGYSSVDAIVPPAATLNFSNLSQGKSVIIDEVAGHSDLSIAKMDTSEVIKFLFSHGV